MLSNDTIFNKIAEALLIDYTSVYYVNAVTNEYQWYSISPEFHSLKLEPSGKDFFIDLVRDADKVVYEEDKHIFMRDMTKENLLAQMRKGEMHSIEYRLMIDGKPVYHTLRLIRGVRESSEYFILGVLNVDKEVRHKLEVEKLEKEREIYNQIAGSLVARYDTLYYIDMETNGYFEYSSTDVYKQMHIPVSGDDFFTESAKNLRTFLHPDDLQRVTPYFTKKGVLRNLKKSNLFKIEYRLIINGKTMNVRGSQIWASDKKHIIVCIENINSEVEEKAKFEEERRKTITYSNIAESLASHYDAIYYVDINDESYMTFTANNLYGSLEIKEKGTDFFNDVKKNAEIVLHPEDKSRILNLISKDHLITILEDRKLYSTDYRLLVSGTQHFTRMNIMWSSDRVHLIIGVANIDEEIRKEKAQVQALNQANELARRDELTGTKNKNAYHELEKSVQQKMDKGSDFVPFAIVVCDINNLKNINDNLGHKAGDEYIRAASRLICNVFTHSPVFRIGGDEFVAFLGSGDFQNRDELFDRLRDQVHDNMQKNDGPVVAAGIATYDHNTDQSVSDVFDRADAMMYADKTRLKEADITGTFTFEPIRDEHKRKLDQLFNAFSLVSEGSYVYICDMKYDYTRWSKEAVEVFGLPGEYIYNTKDVWGEHVHPEDRDTYNSGIYDIFAGNGSSHDMQYRARKVNGEYDVCTCRGVVLRGTNGKPEYFCGAVRNHNVQVHVDALTGLRNQYGFFDDLQSNILRKCAMRICMIGISKFSEINEVYGYQFGNLVLQKFGRHLFEHIGNMGNVYRLDGTKFAILSSSRSSGDMREVYDELRVYARKGLSLDDKYVILDLNAGLMTVDNYTIDHQTVYACLNFAYGESKLRRQGEIVEFYNNLNDENKQRIEKLYAIRASIMQNYKGFYLMYQPVVDAKTEKLIGAEALLRWRSPEYGMVPPDHFIPILEKDPLFCELGQWVLRTAINCAKLIMEENPDFVINVNLSYTQLEKPDFVDMVLRTLKEEGYPPNKLCLEITERCRLLDMYLLKNVIINLRGRGVQIALDDFGTGFSSIGLVKNLPFDTIKIDRSFVLKIEEDDKERELIRSFVSVASTFGAKVCVEGIETEGMKDILQDFHIQSFQGYYYAKPLELRDFIAWKPGKDK
ncbi:MAG: EAL domain-containing protein [Ruminococcus sp.]|nr:EAL domain-containing protein [Ruminococcus sp.]